MARSLLEKILRGQNLKKKSEFFETSKSHIKCFIGGAKDTKPGYRNVSKNLIQVKLKQVDMDYTNLTLEGHKFYNPGISVS